MDIIEIYVGNTLKSNIVNILCLVYPKVQDIKVLSIFEGHGTQDILGCPLPDMPIDHAATLKKLRVRRIMSSSLRYIRNPMLPGMLGTGRILFFFIHSPASDWPMSARKRQGREERTNPTPPFAGVGQHSPFFLSRLALRCSISSVFVGTEGVFHGGWTECERR